MDQLYSTMSTSTSSITHSQISSDANNIPTTHDASIMTLSIEDGLNTKTKSMKTIPLHNPQIETISFPTNFTQKNHDNLVYTSPETISKSESDGNLTTSEETTSEETTSLIKGLLQTSEVIMRPQPSYLNLTYPDTTFIIRRNGYVTNLSTSLATSLSNHITTSLPEVLPASTSDKLVTVKSSHLQTLTSYDLLSYKTIENDEQSTEINYNNTHQIIQSTSSTW
jgi:hypothetical protein